MRDSNLGMLQFIICYKIVKHVCCLLAEYKTSVCLFSVGAVTDIGHSNIRNATSI